ncbi:hypothetical protein V865_003192 [Kwoniella europaea PYCC6329]|uniref:Major facilitator superfamily (MFS) profile domain-containing protein n=1 Tax=Kwoniella europaea PYCC6329 TaxID=1423913 RepID=A0AAX4KFG2_9TREE
MPSLADWRSVTPMLMFCILTFATADFTFGLDTGTFGNLQAMPAFLNEFGERNAAGKMILSTNRKSIMNSVVYLGRMVGVFIFEPATERYGFKMMFVCLCVVQLIAVVIELTSKEWIQFTIGRVLTYVTIGLIEAVIPSYSAEVAPAPLRGFFAGLFVPLQSSVGMLTSGVARAFANTQGKVGWIIPITLQGIPSLIGLSLIFFTVESPRWLLTKGREEEALHNLRRLRNQHDVDAGIPEAEIEAIKSAIAYSNSISQGSWMELFSGPYWRRTIYASIMFMAYEAGGNQFYNAYGPSFLVDAGLGNKSFIYGIIVNLFGAIGSLMTILSTDTIGRRPLCIIGSFLVVLWDCLIAAFGGASDITTNPQKQNITVASFILLIFSTKVAFATHSFIVTTEMGGVRMRKKLMMIGAFHDVLWSFLTAFFTPYIMKSIHADIGYLFAGIAGIGLLYAIFLLPELRGRSLEEVDELFEKPRFRWGWQYKGVVTTGVGAQIANLESHNAAAAMHPDVETGKDSDVAHNVVEVEDQKY